MKYSPLVTLTLLLIPIIAQSQDRFYVRAGAGGANNGQSWADAFTDLQIAVQNAQPGDELWVAEGVYRPTSDTNRDSSFRLPSGAKLYGGFAGTETAVGQRDWLAHPTALSGDIGALGDSTDNSYNILYLDNPDSLTVVDGLVFRFGNAGYPTNDQLATSRYRSGGAIYVLADWEAYATVSNCRFERNSARNHGGAVYVNGAGSVAAAPTFRACVFERNTAGQDGGGMARIGNSSVERPDFVGCVFRENKAGRRGGGLYYQDTNGNSWLDVQGCTFMDNHAMNNGAAAVLRIGRTDGTKARIKSCRFIGNSSATGTGSLSLMNQAALPCQEVVIQGCTFSNDSNIELAYDLLGAPSSIFRIIESRFENHFSFNVLITGDVISHLIFEKDTFVNVPKSTISIGYGQQKTHFNKCVFKNIQFFGPLQADTSLFTNIIVSESSFHTGMVEIDNQNNFAQFSSSNFVGCDIDYFLVGQLGANATFDNCLFNRNNITGSNTFDVIAFMNNCSFDDMLFCDKAICGPNNLFNLDPLFRDTVSGDYSLLPCSPLIDAGSNAAAAGILTDVAGKPRVQGGAVDIGAYEAPAFALASEPLVKPACAGTDGGGIAVSPVFGCEPYVYDWLPQAGNGPELVGLPPGDYRLTVTDGAGRQLSDTISVLSAPNPGLSLDASDLQCGSAQGGSLSASVTSGTAPFHYQWQPAGLPDTSHLSHLPAIAAGGGGPIAYALTVTDANGCQDSASAAIALLGALTLSVGGEVISCHGAADGWLSATPATGAAPFTWLWQGWPGTDSLAQPLGPGAYAVTVADTYGCTASFSFPPMTQPDSLWATVGASPQTDPDMPDGAAVVTTISGGTSPYGFEWSTGGTGQAIAGLVAGHYSVTVKDKNGCEAVVEVFVDSMFTATGEAAVGAWLVWPNPAADQVTVLLPRPVPGGVLELVGADGRVLMRSPAEALAKQGRLDLRGLPTGAYPLRVLDRSGKLLFVGKVVKR